ncbi:glycosyltransferase family 61 protein [Spirosoma montaniterrae]|uniref:Glycosyltransferase 61 catalytic domain-containing protein n=1 Tax=Spirosoma montaniterrae TaxID=1178516 RepID=A0A1P9WS38_9BACT|nr:glycosyltransferase family 61 protein [Spirosoma montaniterrae]AQG78195.1 hypothetical protein AWR27_01835 [Spirosoma montaniterrae]
MITTLQPIQAVSSALRNVLKHQIKELLQWFGANLLTKQRTEAYLDQHQIAVHQHDIIQLHPVVDIADPGKTIFGTTKAITTRSYVWRYENIDRQASLHRSGHVVIQGHVLCTDYNNRDFLTDLVTDFFWHTQRTNLQTPTLLAPWSQYTNGVVFGGYYDFMLLIAAKLCRMKNALPESQFTGAVVAYPLFNTQYEREFLALMGFSPEQVVDSQHTTVQFDRCILGNSGDWTYPNVTDMLQLRQFMRSKIPPLPVRQHNRIYIRRAGRRRVLNEDALMALLTKYDFTIVDDQPRTLAEQFHLYNGASFIMGPHGASFTNILWCEPGTHLLELFSPRYVRDYFRYMAHALGLHYSAYFHGPSIPDNDRAIADDITVSIAELEPYLAACFAGKA